MSMSTIITAIVVLAEGEKARLFYDMAVYGGHGELVANATDGNAYMCRLGQLVAGGGRKVNTRFTAEGEKLVEYQLVIPAKEGL